MYGRSECGLESADFYDELIPAPSNGYLPTHEAVAGSNGSSRAGLLDKWKRGKGDVYTNIEAMEVAPIESLQGVAGGLRCTALSKIVSRKLDV